MAGMIKGTGKFFRDIVVESKKVTWPTGKELLKYTVTVIITVVFLALFFVVVDLGISELLRVITNQ
ncbi:preprotein translocase subunit SecE [Sporolactobacillus terrae]|uniref:Protein translocase subunit SecE n=1 Tax=Sporolactobacillus terrae TaxID=269673 RepID=A0A410D568_9BACL|nr:preprotein translocase subunit SecE [Sporolactobacillus terrae]QAA21257.1 preprotein translocase subunit SecE [Sporolactobacillus terrae]QAA24229.1 preprotein translocase subunit SecE [Sporolactobacillus terrae]UAK16037.1 preprotein translocase subunit SecE [Sporolactobacillus terrae]BBN97397.1 protein translocase subunit SecE [Sporolactobacillus terrae]